MSTKVVTGKVRLSYAYLWEPRASESGNDADARYSVTLLIPKEDKKTLALIQAAIKEAADKFRAKNGSSSLPPKPATTLHDGDGERADGSEFGAECKGHYVLSCRSKDKPVIVDRDRNEIMDKREVYSGCYARASIGFYGYNVSGNKGIAAGLQAIQKLADGEPLGGSFGSANDFNDDFDYDSEFDDEWL